MRSLSPLIILIAIALGVVPLIAFALERGGAVWPDAYVWRVLRFTLLQATLSTVLSVLPAIFVARALARQDFAGRNTLLALFAVPLSMPVIVAVFGITALYGASGWLGGWFNLYGLTGILLAHVFFNLPLATRLLLEALAATPAENHRLAAQLGFSDAAIIRHLDWQALKPALPGVATLVFLLCAGSFVIVLLFGGPAATTLEVAIYQSLRMDFDVSRVLTLSLIQVTLSGVLVLASARMLTAPATQMTLRLDVRRFDGRTGVSRALDGAIIALAVTLVLPVLAAVFANGIASIEPTALFARAVATSVFLAAASTLIALPLAWGLVLAQLRLPRHHNVLLMLGLAAFVVPPAVIATGWFLAFRSFNTLPVILLLIAALNALMALPFVLTVLAPAMHRSSTQHDKLCQQLNIAGWNRFRLVDMPVLLAPLAQGSLMAFVLSMGDLTAVTLLGDQGLVTLPKLVQQQMGHYQSDAAGGTALMLAMICLGLSPLAQRVSRWT